MESGDESASNNDGYTVVMDTLPHVTVKKDLCIMFRCHWVQTLPD
jgi:hypothetical protein